MDSVPAVTALREVLRAQVEGLRRLPLGALATPRAVAETALDEDELALLLGHRSRLVPHLTADAKELGRLAEDAAERFGRQLRERHQYVIWNDSVHQSLVGLFSAYYRRLGDVLAEADAVADLSERLVPVDEGHHARLARLVQSLWREGAAELERVELPDTVSSEYSAGLQLEVLALEPATLLPPILDLGCGPSALLVHHLRNLGLEAYGLERAPSDAPFVQVGDWLDTDFGQGRWGTVVAHLSFTNHFVLHHGASAAAAAEYAQAYMRLLASLTTGGSFHYAPGVPFIEGLLRPDEFSVSRREILVGPDDGGIDAVRVTRQR